MKGKKTMSDKQRYSDIIKQQIKKYSNTLINYEEGKVISNSDGIIIASGLSHVMLNEIVVFENKTEGLVLNINEDVVAIACLGNFGDIKEGSIVKKTNRVSEVMVGDEFLGRVVDATGKAIDGLSPIKTKNFLPIERVAPGVMTRQSVNQPLETGIIVIDSMFPIGRGQRELIIGDRQTGKTTVAIDTIINQKGKGILCVYVAIGQKSSSVSQIKRTLDQHGAMEYTTIISSPADDLPALNYIAPFVGVTLAEYWMSQGKDVLIVYDDLSKHAVSYRTLSLLLKRSPGREAYPGDVFYLHSRLLERACRLNKENGGGSITALPIIETQAGDISAYIPTNVISITDGQLFMQTNLFNAGQRPAVDAGLSVSRVGSAAQFKCMKQVAGSLKLNLANYSELQAFSQFGSDLDDETKLVLLHGEKIMQTIKQKQSSPYANVDQVLLLFIVNKKLIDFIPNDAIANFKDEILVAFKNTSTRQDIDNNKNIDDELSLQLSYFSKKFIVNFINQIPNYEYDPILDKSLLDLNDDEQAAGKRIKTVTNHEKKHTSEEKKAPEEKTTPVKITAPVVTKKTTAPVVVKKAKANDIPTTQKHQIVSMQEFAKYDYNKRRKEWHQKAGYNSKQVQCSICKQKDNWASIKLENGKHICYFCWIKKPASGKVKK